MYNEDFDITGTQDFETGRTQKNIFALIGFICIFALAIWFRWYYHWFVGGLYSYFDWANAYYYGDVADYYLKWSYALLTHQTVPGVFESPPGYAIFISFVQSIGIRSIPALRLTQGIIDSTAVLPLFFILRWAGAKRAAALVACLLYAIFPALAIGSTLIHPQWSAATFIIWSLWLLTLINNKSTSGAVLLISLLLGLFNGFAILFNYNFMVLSLFCALWMLFSVYGFRKLGVLLAFGVGVWIVIASWVYYNQLLEHQNLVLPYQNAVSVKPVNLEDNVLQDFMTGSTDAVKEHFMQWHESTQSMTLDVLTRWKQIIFDASQIPGTEIYFRELVLLMDYFGIFVLLTAVWLLRRNPAVVYIILIPFLQGLISTGFLQRRLFYVDYILISFFLALALMVHVVWQYVDDHPTKGYKKAFNLITILFFGYLFYWGYHIVSNYLYLTQHPNFH